jgi:acetylglutamate kinase
MRVVIKLGGTLLDQPKTLKSLAAQIAALPSGTVPVVVHGGGRQMTRFLEERGVESRFVNGLRVTTPDVLDAVLKIFAGSVNKQLVSALVAEGAPAVGLSGIDARLAEAKQLNPDLGAVGRITRVNAEILEVLCEAGFLPVVACVAGDSDGNVYNVNADQMASALAIAFQADRLLFLTDVDGVRGAGGAILAHLTPDDAKGLIRSGIATGGMQAKLEAACEAVDQGVQEVVIAPGAAPSVLERLSVGEPAGTLLSWNWEPEEDDEEEP